MRNFSVIAKDIIGNFRKLEAYYLIISAIGKELLKIRTSPNKNYFHLKNALNWLIAQQNYSGGFSAQYSLLYGRGNDFPEITGYIIPTLVDYYKYSKDKKCLESAERAGKFLLSIQNQEGWFPDINDESKPMVFDTGQVIFGLLTLYQELKENKFLEAAELAGEWIINQQEPEGFWKKYAYNDIAHTYYSRVSWALLELWQATKNDIFRKSAIKNLDWVLSQQKENGFFKNCSFFKDETPVLHVISYTIEGLLNSGQVLNEKKYILAAQKTADKLLQLNQRDNLLFGYYNETWQPKSKTRCLVGLAQISIIFFRLYEITKNPQYLKEARKINFYLKKNQILSGPSILQGALAGSYPVWGQYMTFSFPNWATKFLIDTLLLEEKHRLNYLTLALFPVDPLYIYINKGEIRKNYWNPGNLFSEVHVFDFAKYSYSNEDKKKLRFMAGNAELFIHQIFCSDLHRLIHQHKIKKQLLKITKKINPDVIRSYGLFLEGFFGRYLSEKIGIPLLISLHGDYDRDIRGQTIRRKKYLKYLFYLFWKYFAELKILRSARQIIAVYQFAADYALKNGIMPEKIHLIYNKVSSSVFLPDPGAPKKQKFTVIHVGRQIPEKNQKTLIKAMEDLDCDLILVGQGPEKENLIRLAQNPNIDQKVKFIEKIDNKDMANLYKQCHAYATANLYGGIEIPIIEAMACGLPIIRSKHPLEKEPELLGFEGCVFVENNPEGFRKGIKKLIEDKNLYQKLSKKSLEIYQGIDSEKMEQKEKIVYLNLL